MVTKSETAKADAITDQVIEVFIKARKGPAPQQTARRARPDPKTETGAPLVAGIEIPMDGQGRVSLNALHKASGADRSKEPAQ